MATRDIVAVGTSAGGLKALQTLVARLPRDYPGALLVVMHISAFRPSVLAQILDRAGPLRAVTATDGMAIEPGRLHVAPPDHHMLVERDRLRVVRGPRENRHRPAIDPLFRSAAWVYGPRVVGIVLSGTLDDGSAGLRAIKSCGGVAVVQDPAEAEHPEMPMNAMQHTQVDYRLPAAEIAELLVRLAGQSVDPAPARARRDTMALEIEAAKLGGDVQAVERLGTLSPFTCPACRGALWEMEEDGYLRYRCHVGHAYSPASLMVDQSNALEQSIFTALRTVEEKAVMLRRLGARFANRLPGVTDDYENRARELDVAAATLKALLSTSKS